MDSGANARSGSGALAPTGTVRDAGSPDSGMGGPSHDPAAHGIHADGSESRGAERFTLLVRAAKLVIAGNEYLCVLRDVSATGVKVKLFHPIPAGPADLELGCGDRYAMQLMWQQDDHAGFRFAQEVDVHTLIDDNRGEFPKRQIRVNIDRPVLLHSGSLAHVAVLRNISQAGACIECEPRLMLRQSVRIEPEGLPPFFAKICWRRHPLHGLVFERGFTLEELARHLVTLQKGVALPGNAEAAKGRAAG